MVQSNTANSGYNAELLADMVQNSLERETLFIGPMFVDGAKTTASSESDKRPVMMKDFSAQATGQGHRKGSTVTWTAEGIFQEATDFNGTVNPQVLSRESRQLTIGFYKELSWEIAERAKMQRSFMDPSYYAQAAAMAWAETIEKTIMPQLILGSLSVGDGTGNMTTDSIQLAGLALEKEGINAANPKYKSACYLTPNTVAALKREGKLSEYQLGGMDSVESWNSNVIKQTPYGIPIVQLPSRTASSLGQAGGTPYQALLTNESLMVGFVQKPKYFVQNEKIASSLSHLTVMSALWGVGVYRPEAMVHFNFSYTNGI